MPRSKTINSSWCELRGAQSCATELHCAIAGDDAWDFTNPFAVTGKQRIAAGATKSTYFDNPQNCPQGKMEASGCRKYLLEATGCHKYKFSLKANGTDSILADAPDRHVIWLASNAAMSNGFLSKMSAGAGAKCPNKIRHVLGDTRRQGKPKAVSSAGSAENKNS